MPFIVPENSATAIAAALLLWHLVSGALVDRGKFFSVGLGHHGLNTLALLPFILLAPIQSFFDYYDSDRFITLCMSGATEDVHLILALGQAARSVMPVFLLGVVAMVQLIWLSRRRQPQQQNQNGRWLFTAGYFGMAGIVLLLQAWNSPQLLQVWTMPAHELFYGSDCRLATTEGYAYDFWANSILLVLPFLALFYWSIRQKGDITSWAVLTAFLLVLVWTASNIYVEQFEVHHQTSFSLAATVVNPLLVSFYASTFWTLGALLIVPFGISRNSIEESASSSADSTA